MECVLINLTSFLFKHLMLKTEPIKTLIMERLNGCLLLKWAFVLWLREKVESDDQTRDWAWNKRPFKYSIKKWNKKAWSGCMVNEIVCVPKHQDCWINRLMKTLDQFFRLQSLIYKGNRVHQPQNEFAKTNQISI